MEGLDVYVPLVDDHGVDCVIKKDDGTFIEIQIKARSSEVTDGDAALFSAITHDLTENFYFVFYSERLDMMWILSSAEFLNECVTNKTGKNKGKRSIWFNGNRKDKQTGIKKEYCKEQFEQYIAKDFSRFPAHWRKTEYGRQSRKLLLPAVILSYTYYSHRAG